MTGVKLYHQKISVQLEASKFRWGKLNSQFIVTARMDFQIFSKLFRFQTLYSKYMAHWPRPSSALIGGRGLGDLEFEHSLSSSLY